MAKIRRMYHVQGKGFKTIAQELQMSKNTINKIIKDEKTRQIYERSVQPYRVLETHKGELTRPKGNEAPILATWTYFI